MTTANVCKEQSCNEKIRGDHYLCRKHWQESQDGIINECPECGAYKNASYNLCVACEKPRTEITGTEPNICRMQFCKKYVPRNFRLCREHWREEQDGVIKKCSQCETYKNARFDLCLACFRQDKIQGLEDERGTKAPQNQQAPDEDALVRPDTFAERIAMLEADRKAQDKRLLFHYQLGKCVYCGNEYGYDKLEIEHMVPKSQGGQDNIRNYQLACNTCNKAKGTMTDIEFRRKHSGILPQKERTPASPPINPSRLRSRA